MFSRRRMLRRELARRCWQLRRRDDEHRRRPAASSLTSRASRRRRYPALHESWRSTHPLGAAIRATSSLCYFVGGSSTIIYVHEASLHAGCINSYPLLMVQLASPRAGRKHTIPYASVHEQVASSIRRLRLDKLDSEAAFQKVSANKGLRNCVNIGKEVISLGWSYTMRREVSPDRRGDSSWTFS